MKGTFYEVVFDSLKGKIISGEYPEGSLLPAEPELQKMYNVSRTTVRKAVEMLTREGLVSPKRGIGTVILKFKITQSLNMITSLTETMRGKGYNVSLRSLDIEIAPKDEELASLFELADDDEIVKVTRVMCISGEPFALIYNYLPHSIVPDIENKKNKITSFYKFLRDEYFLEAEMAQDSITAIAAGRTEAKALDISKGEALLHLERKCIYDGRCFCYDVVSILHDKFEYTTTVYA